MNSDQIALPSADSDVASAGKSQSASTVLAARLAAAYCEGNRIAAADLPAMIVAVHKTLAGLGAAPQATIEARAPAVPPRKSVTDDHLVCLEDGLKFKSLKRHLRVSHDLTPAAYRQKWGLEESYPMVAPAYAKYRSDQALALGLGRKAEVAPPPPAAKAKPGPAQSKASKKPAGQSAKAPPTPTKRSAEPTSSPAESKALPPIRYPANRFAKKAT
ncbi:hypothetical protein D3874_22090 [Oleomonas cavernae]|uniref:MucR family transcriptional regulator n=1 Tax=Oleomonas cavernae TaxID=2320859 RepID=A0A418WH10_9PROT|nr:hypothetical protein D3874_22090 [Oleomonas cavernae]